MALWASFLLYGEIKAMALSSGNKQKRPVAQSVPVNLSLYKGFGNSFRFHYDSKTSQSEWSRKKYHSANDSASKPEAHQTKLPELVANHRAQNEMELGMHDRLMFNVELAIRYHTHRHQHFERIFRYMMLGIVLLAAFALVSGVSSRAVLGLCVIGLAVGTFVWNITHSSRAHDVMRGEYQSLLEHMRAYEDPTENDLRHWRNVNYRIRAKEPALYWGVLDQAYLETARSWHLEPEPREKLPWMLRIFINWLRF
jgi:hypothetical protein